MAQFDLTAKNCLFLDRHLTFPLLEFLCGKEVRKYNIICIRNLKCHVIKFNSKLK